MFVNWPQILSKASFGCKKTMDQMSQIFLFIKKKFIEKKQSNMEENADKIRLVHDI